jgi:hypothetical protein
MDFVNYFGQTPLLDGRPNARVEQRRSVLHSHDRITGGPSSLDMYLTVKGNFGATTVMAGARSFTRFHPKRAVLRLSMYV